MKVTPIKPVLGVSRKNANDDLFAAAKAGDVDGIKRSIESGAEALARDGQRRTALMLAAMRGRKEALGVLLEYGGALLLDGDGRSALSLAAQRGRLGCVEALLPHGVNRKESNAKAWSPLMWAAYGGHEKTASVLMDSFDLLGPYGGYACRLGWVSSGKSEKSKIAAKRTGEALQLGQVAQFRKALSTRPSIRKQKNEWLASLLSDAANHGNVKAAEELMALGALPHGSRDEARMTPFMAACVGNHLECAKALYSDASALNDVNEHGNTALCMSVAQGRLDVARWLVGLGASEAAVPEKHNKWNVLHYAAKFGKEMIELILPMGDPLARNEFQATPLMMAAMHGDLAGCEVLAPLSDLGAKDGKGKRAEDLARGDDFENQEALSAWLRAARLAQKEALALERIVRAKKSLAIREGKAGIGASEVLDKRKWL